MVTESSFPKSTQTATPGTPTPAPGTGTGNLASSTGLTSVGGGGGGGGGNEASRSAGNTGNTANTANSSDTGAVGQHPAGASTGDEVLDRVVQGAHDTVDKLAQTAAPHVKQLHAGLNSASENAGEWAYSLRGTSSELTESLRCTVREHPLAALATALALGVLVARLTESRG